MGGHSTSIRLESAFWDLLDEMARSQNLSTAKFISLLYDEALDLNLDVPNFTSMLRTTCLLQHNVLRRDRGGRRSAGVHRSR